MPVIISRSFASAAAEIFHAAFSIVMKKALVDSRSYSIALFCDLPARIDFHPTHPCSHSRISLARLKTAFEIIQSPLLMDYDVTFYHLNLEVSDQTTFLTGDVTIHAQVVAEQLDTFAIELINGMNIDSVKINNLSGQLHSLR
jgi:hypothetical protein